MTITRAQSWHDSLAEAIRDPKRLIELLELPQELVPVAQHVATHFPLRVPLSFVARMQKGNTNDPLLNQVLPVADELRTTAGFCIDAVGDEASRRAPGLLHKYHGRALLMVCGTCAVHCRYCFRRHFPYETEPRRMQDWEPAFELLERDTSIQEVILSGGDPLMLTDLRLSEIVDRLGAIPHLRRLRVHSRMPIVLPDRVASPLLELLIASRLTPILVVHANHPNEIAGDCEDALRMLVRAGVTTLNQAVLLREINDHVETLAELSERLINVGVIPYYLHQLDRVQGTAHFEVAPEVGRALIAELQKRLPGYAVPRLVREVPGAEHKVLL